MPKTVKQLQAKNSYKQPMQFDVAKAIEPPKIKSADIFDMMGAKKKTATPKVPKKKKKAVPKGSHRMPDGSIMKDSAMKKKKKKY